MIAALEAAQAAHRGQKAAEAEARRAGEKTNPRRLGGSWLRKPPVPHTDAEAALARADGLVADAGIVETARTERDQAGEQAAAAGSCCRG
jgi:hypothetical protein